MLILLTRKYQISSYIWGLRVQASDLYIYREVRVLVVRMMLTFLHCYSVTYQLSVLMKFSQGEL